MMHVVVYALGGGAIGVVIAVAFGAEVTLCCCFTCTNSGIWDVGVSVG